MKDASEASPQQGLNEWRKTFLVSRQKSRNILGGGLERGLGKEKQRFMTADFAGWAEGLVFGPQVRGERWILGHSPKEKCETMAAKLKKLARGAGMSALAWGTVDTVERTRKGRSAKATG
jgi:hypothetical protein